MNNENTIYNDEKTVYDNGKKTNTNNLNPSSVVNDKNVNTKEKDSRLCKAVAGLGFGTLMGVTMSFVSATPNTDDESNSDLTIEDPVDELNGTSSLSDGKIPVATSVSDDMSFAEAFAAARAEVGPGGVFEWNGNVYNTYYAGEWNSMSQDDKNDFASHLNIIEVQEAETSNDNNSDIVPEVVEDDVYDEEIEIHDTIPESINADEEIEIHDTTPESINADEEIEIHDTTPESINADEEIVSTNEIEILGLYEDSESGFVYGEVMIDNQEIILVDVDDDSTFDYAAIDSDHDNYISEEEIADISEYDISYETNEDIDLLAL